MRARGSQYGLPKFQVMIPFPPRAVKSAIREEGIRSQKSAPQSQSSTAMQTRIARTQTPMRNLKRRRSSGMSPQMGPSLPLTAERAAQAMIATENTLNIARNVRANSTLYDTFITFPHSTTETDCSRNATNNRLQQKAYHKGLFGPPIPCCACFRAASSCRILYHNPHDRITSTVSQGSVPPYSP